MIKVIGIDVGGTKVAAQLLGPDGLGAHQQQPTALDSTEQLLGQFADLVRLAAGGGSFDAVGIGVPSVVRSATGEVASSVNIPLEHVQLRKVLGERLGVPVFVDNDATVAALAEAHDDELKLAVDNLVMLTIGTGFGGGIVIGGRIFRGATGGGGEVGHQLIALDVQDDVPMPSGKFPQRGSLESLGSGRALDHFTQAAASAHPESAIGKLAASGKTVLGADAVQAAEAGCAVARTVVRRWAHAIGIGVANAINVFDPDEVVIGGGGAAAGRILIDYASEIAEGNYWQKVVAKAAISALSSYDYAGLLHWEGQEAWLFTLRPIGSGRSSMLRAIDRMTPGDMPDFDPSLQLAMKGLNGVQDAMSKHIVVISDGDPTPPSNAVISQLAASKITVTAVLTAAHGNDPGALQVMRNLALRTKGRFYNVTNPKALPRIYQKEARSISRPLIYEQTTPWVPKLNYPLTEPVMRLSEELPPITGLVLTSPKENELVEIPIVSPLPTGQLNPILAHWTFGLGRSVAFTSDAGRRWAKTWPDWPSYAAFWSQVIRWSMRPADRGNLTLNVRREQGRIKVVIDALDKNNEFLNFLQIQGNVVDPDLKSSSVELVQVAPGRYEGTVENAEASGNYFVNLGYRGPDKTQGVISSGVSVPYSDEYRELRSNPASLESVASLTDGQVVSTKAGADGKYDLERTVASIDHFRRDPKLLNPRSFAPLWPTLLWLAACLFLGDVAVRRIAIDIEWFKHTLIEEWKKLRGTETATASEYMDKLKSRKAEVDEQLDRPRAAARTDASALLFPEQSATGSIGEPLLEGGSPKDRIRAQQPAAPSIATGSPETVKQSYTDRLLKAKQRVWEEREKDKEPDKKETRP